MSESLTKAIHGAEMLRDDLVEARKKVGGRKLLTLNRMIIYLDAIHEILCDIAHVTAKE